MMSDPGEVIEFKETGRPTFITTTGNRDLPVSGRFWVDARDGTILRTELHAVDSGVEAHIVVTLRAGCRHRAARAGADGRTVSARPRPERKCAAWPRTRGSGGSRSTPARNSPTETARARSCGSLRVMIRAMRNAFFLTVLVSLFACSAAPAQQATDPAARVGNRTITTKELDDRWRADDPASQAEATPEDVRRRRAAVEAIVTSRWLTPARRRG